MGLIERVRREALFLKDALRTMRRVRSISRDSPQLSCDDLEDAVDRWPDREALSFAGQTLTFAEFDRMANRFANWARSQRIARGQTVAIFLPNRMEYLPAWYGLNKVGVVAALVNNHLAGPTLAHCINISAAGHVLVDGETGPALAAARPLLDKPAGAWTLGAPSAQEKDLTQALRGASSVRPDRSARSGLTAKDTALYIFTSGTTGLPKPAKMTHMRVQLYMTGFAGATDSNKDDRIYCALPLYHATGGLCAAGAALINGGCFIIAPRFSVSQFWPEVIASRATMFVYIGELCRYLVNEPERPEERLHKIRLAFGNGLRPDVWPKLLERFRIPRIIEFYGATEGNVSMFNFDGKVGAIARAPWYLRGRFNIRLIRFDVESETVIRGPDGLCIECKPGEVGECVGKIGTDVRSAYAGYADRAASEKKIIRDVFRKGDAFFATGDLMRQDAEGYFYFVDRIGDTFRWKSENVSTTEVAGCLAQTPGVREAIVYGVQVGDNDGRAGMASLVVGPEFDIKALGEQVAASLPSYAGPYFVRLQNEAEVTGTFKYRKIDLVADGFDPDKVKGPVFYRNPAKGYVRLTRPTYQKIVSGELRL
jgi:fatty-acyl-CoA synthase